jgi:hypothetical protein
VQEKRSHYRKSVGWEVQFSVGEQAPVNGVCRDLSLGGMNVHTDAPARFGARVTLHVRLHGMSDIRKLPGIVRWVKDGAMGVQFGLLGARDTYAITEMLVLDR